MPNDVVDLLACWPGKFRKHRNGAIWIMVPHCLMWGIWRERNAQTFEGNESLIQEMNRSFFQTLFGWTNALGILSFSSFAVLLDRCTLCTSYFCFLLISILIHVLCALALLY